jgi:4-hydroxy-3-methylbut-2-en-1-yl diphosphate reductase
MPAYIVCAPTLAEARSLRRGLRRSAQASASATSTPVPYGAQSALAGTVLSGASAGAGAEVDADVVRRIGVGRSHAERAARSPSLRGADALVVAGIAGGLDADLAPGDVVVATEVRAAEPADDRVVTCASAPLLAGALRRAGFRVHTGPVVTTDHIVTSATERKELAATGALAVDMESAWLLRTADGRPTACVRVVADPATTPLLHPATVGHLRTALRTLTALAPVLRSWGAAVGSRQVLLASPRSFCAGVERAIDIVERMLDQRGAPIYVRKQIVHNAHVVRGLEERGAVFVDELDEVPDGATVVFSAHGVAPDVRNAADVRDLAVVDATCPLVAKVHSEARRFADRGDTVLFIGHAGHEETEGTIGERPGSTLLVEDVDDAGRVQVPDPSRVSYLVQTTLAVDEVDAIVHTLHERFPALQAPGSDDICYATTNRQRALRAVADESSLVLVVGSANSSNSNRLVETAQRMGTPAYLVDDASDIDLAWLAGATTVAVTAGASAPTELVDEVVSTLAGLGQIVVHEREVTREDIRFTLPKEVRP